MINAPTLSVTSWGSTPDGHHWLRNSTVSFMYLTLNTPVIHHMMGHHNIHILVQGHHHCSFLYS